ncbi:MAG: hypothetical protein KDB51_18370 [Propionibacteriaceae bacterium]|nr:hypothetical protein [Propionibacteriaceae bacterium]
MSYDLHVFGREHLDRAAVAKLCSSGDLAVDERASGEGLLVVVRGVRRRYCFTVGLAAEIEPEDVPKDVAPLVLEPHYFYEVVVEGSSASEVPHAARFARRLAHRCSGVVVDEQEGTVWSRGKLRTPPKADRGLVDIVELRWWITSRTDPVEAAAAWVELAGRHLPEALPRRWGVVEPLSDKPDSEHPHAFERSVGRREGTVYFKGSAPAIDGHLGVFNCGRNLDSVTLSVHRAALGDPAWRRPLRRLFVDFASRVDAVVATAEVIRNIQWSGRTLWYGPEAEHAPYLATRQGWVGLPPYPVWLIWFGRDYVPLVQQHLEPARVQVAGTGLLHSRSVDPTDRDQLNTDLAEQARPRSWIARVTGHATKPVPQASWLPADLLAVQPTFDSTRQAAPLLEPARLRPAALQ